MARIGIEGDDTRRGAWHRTLVYFGLADDAKPSHPLGNDDGTPPRPPDGSENETRRLLEALERRVAENTAAIEALRAEVQRMSRF